jgi:hypothetical protein
MQEHRTMAKQKRTIQRELELLVEMRVYQLGYDSLFDFMQHSKRSELFDEPLCPLIVPGCPTDLCFLPAGHPGTDEGYHITGTTAYDAAIQHADPELAPVGTSRSELVKRGAAKARILWPDDFRLAKWVL